MLFAVVAIFATAKLAITEQAGMKTLTVEFETTRTKALARSIGHGDMGKQMVLKHLEIVCRAIVWQ